ncbi:LLM class flavin-dependent oxidoreductase [Actinomadura sp. NAK00032]|uniref:LLM class flavin-dependent oxidoreductase n=1 Tax=Actinomadura sp. NAK00032 TaxID=2742128 RepID=UPI001590C1EF|nr:LLM class flavin-dependent oxidoreductase [Actinomadura sp. NAK00032]
MVRWPSADGGGRTGRIGWDALTALTLAGTAAPGIELGTAVVPAPQRHPLVLAGQALSVQAATGNRLTLGLGAGISMMVTGMYGLPADRPAARMREYLSVLRPPSCAERRSLSVPGTTPPPILLAALAPAMLPGELADGTVAWMTGPRTLAGHVPEYRAVLDREQVTGPEPAGTPAAAEKAGPAASAPGRCVWGDRHPPPVPGPPRSGSSEAARQRSCRHRPTADRRPVWPCAAAWNQAFQMLVEC